MKPHEGLKYIRPDEVAECWDGVFGFGNLYEVLWECVPLYDKDVRANIEDIGPADVIGVDSVARFWHVFNEAEKAKLNELAAKQEELWA